MAYQQGAVVVQLPQQDTAIVKKVEGFDTGVQLSEVGLQPSIQLCVDVELPGIGWFLHLWWEREAYDIDGGHFCNILPGGIPRRHRSTASTLSLFNSNDLLPLAQP